MDEDSDEEYIPYGKRIEWEDVKGIPQGEDDDAVVPINYSDEYRDAMNYFRTIFQKEEISKRALQLVTHVIELNPGNYTAWYYRRKLLNGLQITLKEEMKYLDEVIFDNEKNYQVWYHRQRVFEIHEKSVFSKGKEEIEKEKKFLWEILESDSKNYHCWSYRQWLVEHFNLWDGEFEFTEKLIEKDVRNNSAWNYRFFLNEKRTKMDKVTRMKEIDYAFQNIEKAPNNESPWNFSKGMVSYKNFENKKEVFEYLEKKSRILFEKVKTKETNVHLLNVLIECNLYQINELNNKDKKRIEEAAKLCQVLIKYDGIRKKYWEYKLEKIKQIS